MVKNLRARQETQVQSLGRECRRGAEKAAEVRHRWGWREESELKTCARE